MSTHFIGLMSGTSLDGIDAVLAELHPTSPLRVIAHAHSTFAGNTRRELLALNSSGEDELHRAALAGNALTRQYAALVETLLTQASFDRRNVKAIGAHGQTVRHRPGEFDGIGYTVQLLAPALLAELTRIDVICDFRNRDVAAGGQGAPLAPAFHGAMFGHRAPSVAVLNIGGISNITVILDQKVVGGFDCGPGNSLMDYWCQRHTSARFDDQGAWAASGTVDDRLLAALLREPYFSAPPPKSTGRDLFNPSWLEARLQAFGAPIDPAHVQASLAELTAQVCASDVRASVPDAKLLVVCGGGAFNRHLLGRIAAHLPSTRVGPSDELGLPADQVEACAFAWLASAFVDRRAGNLPQVTGARAPRLLGALYPAG
jgi:anhydro-N-acetylmuramic acid kinase